MKVCKGGGRGYQIIQIYLFIGLESTLQPTNP